MKKLTILLGVFSLGMDLAIASTVPQETAQKVATNFYTQNLPTPVKNVTLAYTEKNTDGTAVYYVFDINDKDGFVIVSADDALKPIIGYSYTGHYVIPAANTNIDFWMQKRKTEIISDVKNKVAATPEIADDWSSYKNNTIPKSVKKSKHHTPPGSSFPSSTFYLVKSTWDQSPDPYYTFCPSSSVTGCVATTMAQIMRYWSYPATGSGNSCYSDEQSYGFQENYGTLCAKYAHPYYWANMTLTNPPAGDTDLARIMYDAGVSVEMDYSPSGSGAIVLGGYPSAQYSYPNYFGYSSNILDGITATNYSATAWQDTLENDLNRNRVVQYAGFDGNGSGGHTWVCDGYNASNNFHMNWGWSGTDDGWFALSNLTPAGTGLDFNQDIQALVGIMPPVAATGNGICDTVSNFPSNGTPTYYSAGKGFVTGCYGDTIQQVSDYFASPPPVGYVINSVYIYFAKASSKTPGRTVNINIWDNTGTGGSPGAIKASKTVTVSSLLTNNLTLITFNSPVTVTTPYYAGVDFTTVAAAYKTDTIVVVTDEVGQGTPTAWEYFVDPKYSIKAWYPDSSIWSKFYVSQAIWVNMCPISTEVNTIADLNDGVNLYPNPTNGKITAQVSLENAKELYVEIYNMLGQQVQQLHWSNTSNATYTIDLSGQPNGMFFVKMSSDNVNITKKVMLVR